MKDLLPIEPSMGGRGRRPTENRAVVNGILWRLRCGAPCRDAPEKYGKWNTVYRRFRRWSEAGTWEIVSVSQDGVIRMPVEAFVVVGGRP